MLALTSICGPLCSTYRERTRPVPRSTVTVMWTHFSSGSAMLTSLVFPQTAHVPLTRCTPGYLHKVLQALLTCWRDTKPSLFGKAGVTQRALLLF